uniref:Bis(5'-adenosyl)-triphosphatase n=1 Tax=Elaeophora elaphi TaxID=1147741 RepID=A0A0R3S5E2_9BILA
MDGFRYDLLNATLVPNIWKLATEGVYFKDGCRPQYLTYTAPNHVSLATGLLVESHGIVGNFFHDLATNTTPWMEYKNLSQWMDDFDEIVELFTRQKDPYNFIAWYIAEPDHFLHYNGFKNGKLNEKMQELDLLVKYINDKLENNPELSKQLNIILASDHGHAEMTLQIGGPSNVLCLIEVINIKGIVFGDRMIYVKNADRKHQIYRNLKKAIEDGHYGIKIYLKEDIPVEYGYSKNDKIGDIVLETEPGYNVRTDCSHDVVGTANNLDLYPLMCYILGVIPAPSNGTLQHMMEVLKVPITPIHSLPTKEIEVV